MKFKVTAIGTLVVGTVFILWSWYHSTPWEWLLVILLLFVLILAYGSFSIGFNFYLSSLNGKNTTEKLVALTFDDGPDSAGTESILEVLQKHQAPSSFFVIGSQVLKNRALLQKIHEQGHLIGNHTQNHSNLFGTMGVARVQKEIENCNQAIFDAIAKKPRLFRPPFGVTNPNIARAIKNMGMECIGWNVRSLDTVVSLNEKLVKNLMVKVQPGAVVLLHDRLKGNAAVVEALVIELKNKGYRFVRIDEMFDVKAYE